MDYDLFFFKECQNNKNNSQSSKTVKFKLTLSPKLYKIYLQKPLLKKYSDQCGKKNKELMSQVFIFLDDYLHYEK